MKAITKEIQAEFNPDLFKALTDIEKTKAVYSNSEKLPSNTDYRKIVINVFFKDTNKNPDTLQVYCFNPKTNVEKNIFSFFRFPKHNLLSPYHNQKPNHLTIDIDLEFDGRDFSSNEGYLIDRIGFCIDNVKSSIPFNYQICLKN